MAATRCRYAFVRRYRGSRGPGPASSSLIPDLLTPFARTASSQHTYAGDCVCCWKRIHLHHMDKIWWFRRQSNPLHTTDRPAAHEHGTIIWATASLGPYADRNPVARRSRTYRMASVL